MRKVVKWVGIAVLVLLVVLVGGGTLLPGTFTVSRSVVIAAPADQVYALVAAPRAWSRWSVWMLRDPAAVITYSGPESGAGAGWRWQSKSQGNGAMQMTSAEPGRHVAFDLLFEDFATKSTGDFRFTPEASGTRVTWSMNGDMGANPAFHWIALFGDRMVGGDFEQGLANLKQVAEAK